MVILKANVRLVDNPPRARCWCSATRTSTGRRSRAGDHEFKPIALEGIDDRLVDDMKETPCIRRTSLLPEGGGWLVVEFGGDTNADADAKATAAMDALGRATRPR